MKPVSEARSGAADHDTAQILGVPVSSRLTSEVLDILHDILTNKAHDKPYFVVTVNPEFVMLARRDKEFRRILASADLAIPDGNGLKLASPKIREAIPGRVVALQLLTHRYRTFFLGGREGVARQMAEIYGGEWDEGHTDIKTQLENEEINTAIVKKINRYHPEVLLVAYGAPWQEKWIWRHREKLKAKVVMGVGGTFDYLTGRAKLPPWFVSQLGMEWAWRLWREPLRWRRQIRLVEYAVLALFSRLSG